MYAAHVPAGDGPFPTVLALHGWGASAHDLLGLAPFFLGGEALVLCPQGPVEVPIAPGVAGYGWFPISAGSPPDARAFGAAGEMLERYLSEAERRYPIDPRKLVLLGFSQGGAMGYDLFLRQPERFAGLAALSSWLPPGVADGISAGPALENRPVLVVHGTTDPMIDVARGAESRDRLIALGLAVRYREYEMGHEISPEALRDLVGWLEDQLSSPIHLL